MSKPAKNFNNWAFSFFTSAVSAPIFALQSTDSDLKVQTMNERLTVLAFGRQCQRMALMLAVLCLSLTAGAQGFEKKFGGPKDDFGQAILQTKDHGYIEVGRTGGELGDDNDVDIFVVRTDVDGTVIWTKQYDEGFLEQAEDVVEVNDGEFLVIGFRQETPTAPTQTYLVRLDRFGEMVFSRSYGSEGLGEKATKITSLPNDEFLISGNRKQADGGETDALITKVNGNGDIIWRTVLNDAFTSEALGAIATPQGGVIVGTNVKASILETGNIQLYGLSAAGETTWTQTYGTNEKTERLNGMILTTDNHLVFVGSTENGTKALIAKADLNGDTLWYHEINAGPLDDILYNVIEQDGGESLVAVGQTVPTPANLDVLMVKVRANDGLILWQRRLGDEETLDVGRDLARTTDGGFALAGFNARFDGVLGNEMVLFKTDDLGDLQTNYLRGRVYRPATDDCSPYQDGDRGQPGWLIRAESNANVFFGSTDSLGNYELRVDQDEYGVSLLRRNDRWEICEPNPLTVDLTVAYDSSRHDFAVTPAFDCPLLEVTMSATPAIQCDNQRITINYNNSGTATATGASVTLELDNKLTLLTASLPYTNGENGMLIFGLGDLAPSTEGTIVLTTRVACTGVVDGEAISSRTTIYPLIECAPVSDDWDGSSIVVTSRCDLVEGLSFFITNIGEDMTTTNGYVIIEDILLRGQSTFMLEALETERIDIDLSGDGEVGTYRLIAEQSDGHPGNSFPTAVAEGCQPQSGNVSFTTGFVAQFPDNDGNLYLDILTQEIVALPEDATLTLTAYPRGYQDAIIIPKTDIEYTVFFALPGNDSFERVVIRDTLPEPLDVNSLEMGAASHPYDFTLYQGGILKITFDSIRIFSGGGTGEADAVTRQGYVSYRLSQKPNLTQGTVIRNRAAVYFDYQQPELSQEVRHVVGCDQLFEGDCLLISSSGNLPNATGVTISVGPNPIKERTRVRIEGWERPDTEFTFQLFDAAGRNVVRQSFRGDVFEFLRPNLASGAYFYEVTGGGFNIGAGQLTLQ
jgi:hypothetical protein